MDQPVKNWVVFADEQSLPAQLVEPPRRPKWTDTFAYIADPDQFCRHNLAKYGPVFKTSVFGGTTIFVGSAEAIQMTFNGDADYTEIGLPATTMDMFGEFSLFQRPDLHRQRKSSLRPAFSGNMLADYCTKIHPLVTEHLQTWQIAEPIALTPLLEDFVFDLLVLQLLGIPLNQGDVALTGLPIATKAELKRQYQTFFDGFYGLVKWQSPLTTFGRGKRARAKLIDFMRALIQQRRQTPLEPATDFLSMMLASQQENPDGVFSDDLIENQCLLQLWASHYEVSILLSDWMYQVGQYPQCIEQVRAEQVAVLGKEGCLETLSMGQLKPLVFLDATIKETLRLLPPSSTATRKLTKSVVLDGVLFKSGWNLIAEPRIAHAIEAYFANPDQFKPERFLPEQGEGRMYEYIPFGGGVHACLGAQLAIATAKIFILHLLQRFDWELTGEADFIQFPLKRIKSNYRIQLRARSDNA